MVRIVLNVGKRLKCLGCKPRGGIWLLALMALLAGLRVPAAGALWRPRPLQDQALGIQNPASQQSPEAEQGQPEAGTEPQQPAGTDQPDEVLVGIRAILENVASPDLETLGQAFNTTVKKPEDAAGEPSVVELINLGDLDGDGAPEITLKAPAPEVTTADAQTQATSTPLQGLYLLSWDGAHWKVSTLAPSAIRSSFRSSGLARKAVGLLW